MTGEEWRAQRERLAELDPTAAFAELRSSISEGFDRMAAAFTGYQADAIRFYEAGVTRVQAVVRGAIDGMSQSGATTGAIVLGLPWLNTAAALLRSENVGFARVVPDGITMAPMLNEAGVFVGEPSDYQRRTRELFTGRRVRDRIEALSTRATESRAHLAEVWAMAGQGLTVAGDWTRADECFDRALMFDPAAYTYSWAGAHAVNQRQYERAIPLLKLALRLDPLAAESWGTYGLALAGTNQHGAALRALVTSVRLAPGTGSLWCHLGLFYHHRGRTAAACHAFAKGRDLGDADCAHNFRVVCHSGAYPRPRELRPSVRWLMRRLGLSLQHSIRRLRSPRPVLGRRSGPAGRLHRV